MTTDIQREYQRLIHIFQNPNFSQDEDIAITDELENELGLARIAARIWMRCRRIMHFQTYLACSW